MMMRQLKIKHLVGAVAMMGLAVFSGCVPEKPQREVKKPVFEVLPPKEVPGFLKGTIYQLADSGNKDPFVVSGYGLVVNLAGTGDNRQVPLPVREYMYKQMQQHGYGSVGRGLEGVPPDRVMADSRTAIVEVYGIMPPGARKGQRVDVVVQACTGSETSSLARGALYQTDMFVGGVNPMAPFGQIHTLMIAQGPLFINPGYAMAKDNSVENTAGAIKGSVVGGGRCMYDVPLMLRVREPSISMARAIEFRIQEKFKDKAIARMQDEANLKIYVPVKFEGDWRHFLGVAMHLYLDGTPAFGTAKARELAAEAVKPGALLNNISFAWEGIGEPALPFIRPLYGNATPEIAFSAARAGACIGDDLAGEALRDMALTEGHPFQVEAVKTMRFMSDTPRVNGFIKPILEAKNAQAKIEAYRILSDRNDPAIVSRPVGDFYMDRVLSEGKLMVFARRTGSQRLVIFGRNTAIDSNIMYGVLDNKFTLSKDPESGNLMAFDRTDPRFPEGRRVMARPDLADLVVRLGGTSATGVAGMGFSYAEVLGIVQGLVEKHRVADSIVVDDLQQIGDEVDNAPPLGLPEGSGPLGLNGEVPALPGLVKPDDKLGN